MTYDPHPHQPAPPGASDAASVMLNRCLEAEEGGGLDLTAMRNEEELTPESFAGYSAVLDEGDTSNYERGWQELGKLA